ncbi:MAG TPA: TIM barrel protein [Ktedonobacterales bacterium]|nr:TIM barrel protein [Ktedonobacterales bacterium]
MQISFSTGAFYHRSFAYSLWLAREVGFDGVEVALGPEYLLRGARSLRAQSERMGVPVLSVHPPFLPFPGWPYRAQRAIPRAAQVARELGAGVCVIHTLFLTGEQTPRALRYTDALKAGLAAGAGSVAIAIESAQYKTQPPRRRYLLDDLASLASFAQARGCALTFDTCHAGANGEDLLACYEIVRPVLRNIHLSDMVWRKGEALTHHMPGEGTLALRPLLARLARDGYEGLVTLELAPNEVGWWDRRYAERRLAQALDFVRQAIIAP